VTVLMLLIPLSVLIAACFLAAFIWAVRSGQYEDTCTPALRILTDDVPARSVRGAANPVEVPPSPGEPVGRRSTEVGTALDTPLRRSPAKPVRDPRRVHPFP
jgi:cbb3-type cytochrome oxidase maturation protein